MYMKMCFLPQLVIITCFLISMASPLLPQLNDDVLGLIVFKSDLHDPSSSLSSWSEDDDSPCSWQFIKCNPVNGRVSELSLDNLALSGKINRGLQKLQHLKVLSLSHNNLTSSSSISLDLFFPPSLEKLDLSHNKFSSQIPISLLDTMNSLKFLDFSNNSFFGLVPYNLFEQSSTCSLHYLSLARNKLEGPIPSTLSRCLYLNSLNLSNNHFSGNPDFVSGIWLLNRLRRLDLSNNLLSGSLPTGISGLHFLKELLLHTNQFSGQLPSDLGLCPHLTRLDCSKNLFTGTIPESLQLVSPLTFFSVADNQITGQFPEWIGKMTNLEYLDLSRNGLSGSLPFSISDLKSIKHLSFSVNKLVGNLPEGLFELGLEEIDLSDNKFTGLIPLGSTRLFETLQVLDLSRNNLKGNFLVTEMNMYSNLRYLNLSWNNLQTRISSDVKFFRNLTVLDLRNSGLSGSIPRDICSSESLDLLQLDGNSFTGPIPDQIGNCSSLYLLSLSHNKLSGSIPKTISKLSKLKILKLEFNELSGEIPTELGRMGNLLALNISYNRLTGKLPEGSIFPSLDQSALQGNLGLCSPLLKGPCKMNVPKPLVLDPDAYFNKTGHHGDGEHGSPEHSGRFRHHMFLSVSSIIAISAAALICCGVIVITLLNLSAARKSVQFMEHTLESICSSSSSTSKKGPSAAQGKLILFDRRPSFSGPFDQEMLFNKGCEIGEGVFGTVYKAKLGSQGQMVAIKKLITSNTINSLEEFDREVRILGNSKHPNIVTLKGYFWTPQMQLLVTEYASNGSLQSKLHERIPSTPPLSWTERFEIVLGIAKGLAHLHHAFPPPIIHYNIKPSNVLLDENNNPKISDFGLLRIVKKVEKHIIRDRFQSGLGYAAPEMACQRLRVNEKCDVYGFGVMVLEIVSGKRPLEYGEDRVVILTDHVRALVEQENVMGCVDPSMEGDYVEDEVVPLVKLALVCTSQLPSSRPSMAEVVQILQLIRAPVPLRMEGEF